MKSGKRFSNSIATIHFLVSENNQFAVVASKAVGNAVIRNRAKRRTKAVLYELQDKVPCVDAVIRLRSGAAGASWEEFDRGIRDLMGRVR